MASIYAPLGPTVGAIIRFSISTTNSRGLHVIIDVADAEKLKELLCVKSNDAIDLSSSPTGVGRRLVNATGSAARAVRHKFKSCSRNQD